MEAMFSNGVDVQQWRRCLEMESMVSNGDDVYHSSLKQAGFCTNVHTLHPRAQDHTPTTTMAMASLERELSSAVSQALSNIAVLDIPGLVD